MASPNDGDIQQYITEPISFGSGGTVVVGVLYRPESAGPVPGVVLAHGFSGTMDWIVPDFATRFAQAGLAALTFDYRHLGVSGGEPRQLIDCGRQREDLRNALAFMRSRDGIDGERIALWGTSLGGAHVLEVAADDHRIAAVVANVPAVDLFRGIRARFVPAHLRMGPGRVALATGNLLRLAVFDAVRGALGAMPRYIPVYGRMGQAVFYDPELAGLFRDVERNAPTWRNQVTPRFLFTAPHISRNVLRRIASPLLVTLARDDEVTSAAFVRDAVEVVPHHEIVEYPVRHFDIYHAPVRDEVIATHLGFLCRHLMSNQVSGADDL